MPQVFLWPRQVGKTEMRRIMEITGRAVPTSDLYRYLYGQFIPTDAALVDLAAEYFLRTEEYDRTVCSGPIGRDGIMPANAHELGAVNRNARQVRRELIERAHHAGFSKKQFEYALIEQDRKGRAGQVANEMEEIDTRGGLK
jgi:hypothetical protein